MLVRRNLLVACCASAVALTPVHCRQAETAPPAAVPNDNRSPGGRLAGGVTELHLVARLAAWTPDLDVDSAVTVQAFAEAGGAPRIPGPLLRAGAGTEIRVTVSNDIADSTLVVHGLRAGTVAADTVHVLPGTRRELRFTAGEPGTYLYWGTTTGQAGMATRTARDGQLTGAIVIDAAAAGPDPAERIFVITLIDILPDTTKPPPQEDIWELAINGRAWPHTERLEYGVGETVRWRWLNGSPYAHPMHLHGFHFRVTRKGDGVADRPYAPEQVRHVVTEFMPPGSTFAMEWTPTRAGNWLFHCHMAPHITPFPARPDSVQDHDVHDVAQHAIQGMAGLVLGIHTVQRALPASPRPPAPARQLRLFAQQGPPAERPELRPGGFVLQDHAPPRPDSVRVPGSPLVLTRDETTAITVINRLDRPTTVHWHGMELESFFDGVAGWSGAPAALAPLIAPGDSFVVAFTPPRAGTYIYHTHMDEGFQLASGMYGALLVLEPGERYDPATDIPIIVGRAVDAGENRPVINGRHEPPPLLLRAGIAYRLRIINILPAAPVEVTLLQGDALLRWVPVGKDGAALPAALQVEGPARVAHVGVGETYDFVWTPAAAMDAVLRFEDAGEGLLLTQAVRVR